MRGPLKATLLLAPALASALAVPGIGESYESFDRSVSDHSSALVSVEVPTHSRSPDGSVDQLFGLRIDVLRSEAACGYGNLTIDGQVLPQTLEGNVLVGTGPISVEGKSVIVASWVFHCIKVNGQPEAQLLKFDVDFVDGKEMQNTGFYVAFKQTGETEIINIETDFSVPAEIVANPNPEDLQPVGESKESSSYNIEEDVAELQWMRAQLEELQFLIADKERTITDHMSDRSDEDISDCDSLKCVMKAIADRARKAAHHFYGKLSGDELDHREHGHSSKHWPKNPFHHGHKGDGTNGTPKHGNSNHTHPGPPFKKPHFGHRPLPICRYPPPPPHGHHGPPHHGKGDHLPDFPHHIQEHNGRPHHGPEHDERPHHGPKHDGPEHDFPHHGPEHQEPPHHGPEHPHHGSEDGDRPHHDKPDPDHFPPGPPPEFHHGPDHPPHHDRPGPPPEFRKEQEHMGGRRRDDFPLHHGEPFQGPPPHAMPLQIIKFTAIGFLFAFLIVALHRRSCTSTHKKSRKARREERHQRRASRRAAKKYPLFRFLSRFSGNDSDSEFGDYEEKREALLAGKDDLSSTTLTDEISQFRNAASVVDDMITAEEGRSRVAVEPVAVMQLESSSLMQDYEIGSQVGDGEELPAYEDNDGTEGGSFVADGFRYTPGSSEYSPAHSMSGSVSDILGPDTKQ